MGRNIGFFFSGFGIEIGIRLRIFGGRLAVRPWYRSRTGPRVEVIDRETRVDKRTGVGDVLGLDAVEFVRHGTRDGRDEIVQALLMKQRNEYLERDVLDISFGFWLSTSRAYRRRCEDEKTRRDEERKMETRKIEETGTHIARLLSESEIGQGGLRRACSEEEEGVKGKKEEEVQRLGEIVNREGRICIYEDWTASVWWYGSGETLRAEGAEPDWLVFRALKSANKPDVNIGIGRPTARRIECVPFQVLQTGRVALRERDSEREGGEWYHAASVGIEHDDCRRDETFVFFIASLDGSSAGHRQPLSAQPRVPRRLDVFGRRRPAPGSPQGPYAGMPSPPESARINIDACPCPRTTILPTLTGIGTRIHNRSGPGPAHRAYEGR
ncbi:hypothetical protein B0H13DRAFT_1895482 [Mycena leptocephala]|nr:hypothetical protein B0H13DRAFT_1895482 [Mycena leptocephala]